MAVCLRLLLILASVSGAFSTAACAGDQPPAASRNAQLPGFFDRFIDLPHEYLSSKFVDLASGVDDFFGNDRSFQESNKSVLQFDLTRLYESNSSGSFVPSFRAKLHLPGTQDRLHQWLERVHLLLETNPDRNLQGAGAGGIVQQGRGTLFNEVATPDSYGAALRFENREDSAWRASADTGLKLVNATDVMKLNQTGLDPFVRTRFSYLYPAGITQLKLTESLFWFNTVGAGESTQFDADYKISDPLLFRATSGATWLHDTQNFDLRQDFSLYQTLNESVSRLYQASVIGVTKPQAQVAEYVVLMLHRQRIHRDWMFLELSPQLHYPRVNNYQLNAQFIIRLEILFAK